jgi:hypothetical protein
MAVGQVSIATAADGRGHRPGSTQPLSGTAAVNGIANFVTLLFLLVSFFVFAYYLRMREIRRQGDDYRLLLDRRLEPTTRRVEENPDDWRDFFEQFTPDNEDQVTIATIALNNGEPIRKPIQRRILRRKLRLILPEGVDSNDDASVRIEIVRYNQRRRK